MKLSKYREDSDYYSRSASSINRNLSFSGIAIIWLFTQSEESGLELQRILIISLALLAISLLIDLLQYCFGFYKWSKFHRQQELNTIQAGQELDEEKIDVLAPTGIKSVIDTFFWLKIGSNIIAYALIIIFLVDKIFVK